MKNYIALGCREPVVSCTFTNSKSDSPYDVASPILRTGSRYACVASLCWLQARSWKKAQYDYGKWEMET